MHIPIKIRGILYGVVLRRSPRLQNLFYRFNDLKFNCEQIDEMLEILSDEFCENGLKCDDEPNAYGLVIDELIGILVSEKILLQESQ